MMQSSQSTSKTPAWRHWCRLCAKDDADSNTSISKNENAGMDMATAIGKYFWVNIKQNDELPQCLCVECCTLLASLVAFTERVNKVQAMFCVLQNTSSSDGVDLRKMRVQYGLLEENRVHIIDSKNQTNRPVRALELLNPCSEEECQNKVEVVRVVHKAEKETEDHQELRTKRATAAENSHSIEAGDGSNDEDDDNDDDDDFVFADDNATVLKRIKRIANSNKHMPCKSKEEPLTLKHNMEVEVEQIEEIDVPDDEYMLKSEYIENGSCDELVCQVEDCVEPIEHIASEGEDDESDEMKEFEEFTDNNDIEYQPDEDVSISEANTNSDSSHANDLPTETGKRKRGRPPKSAAVATRSRYVVPMKRARALNDFHYECRLCHRRYKNATSYRKHMTEQHDTTPDLPDFKCEICETICPTQRQLAVHRRRHMPLAEKQDVPCPYCEKKFTKVTLMRQHVAGVHRNEKPFVCDQCGRELKTLAALNEHKLVHTSVCPWECGVCQKRFKNKARLKVHADTHNETGYMCNQCGLKLNTRRTLKMHMRVHEDVTPFSCDFCGIHFKRSKALKNHLILHSGLKPYKCNFCDRTFSNGSNCRAHKKKSHPIELAQEEAQGKKPERTMVPKLEELRATQNIAITPRRVKRNRGGLPEHQRALIIAAEKRKREIRVAAGAAEGTIIDGGVQTFVVTDPGSLIYDEYDTGEVVIEEHERDCTEDYANDDDDDDEDDEGGETVIYEIIDEI